MASSSAARAALVEQVEAYLDAVSAFITGDDLLIERHEREQARQDIDDALSRLDTSFKRMRSALLRERNSAIVGASIPTEILVEIFGYGGVQTALLATKVCHRWRVAALNHPPLWSKINMNSRRYSDKLLKMQLERAGPNPLDITFSIYMFSDMVENQRLPQSPGEFIKKASSISNISTRTLLPYWSERLTLLEALHLVVDPDAPVEDFTFKMTNLRHLSIDFGTRGTLTVASQTFRNLRTLHLTRSRESAIRVLRAVSILNGLEELTIDTCDNREEVSTEMVEGELRRSRFKPPRRIHINRVSPPFLTCFLAPDMLGVSTSLRIEPRPPAPYQRALPATACWIDFNHKYTLYEHGNPDVLTRLALGDSDDTNVDPPGEIPAFVPLNSITSLHWKGGNLPHPPFEALPSLVSLAFEFHPARVGEPKSGLGDVMEGLAYYCPRMEYLAISIRRPKAQSALLQRDDAEDQLAKFLESWIELYGEVFSKVELYDEYRPLRWGPRLDILRACTWNFQIAERCMLGRVIIPSFPHLRRFVVEEDDVAPRPFRGFAQTFW